MGSPVYCIVLYCILSFNYQPHHLLLTAYICDCCPDSGVVIVSYNTLIIITGDGERVLGYE